MKWRLNFFLVFFALFASVPLVQAGELPFTDAHYGSHFEAMFQMKEWGIFEGYSDGSFGYNKEINRAELSKVLVLGSGVTEEEVSGCAEGATKTFSDVASDEWFAGYVYCAQAKGWVSGDDGKDTFRPSDPVLLSEAFKMILESQYGTPDSSFEGEQWYDVYVNALDQFMIIDRDTSYSIDYYNYTFIPGYSNMGFESLITSKTTRQDVAELIYRLRVVLEEGDDELVAYDPTLSVSEYEEQYGASVEETAPGVLTIADPTLGFEMTNVYIGEADVDDLQIWIKEPSGFLNGSQTQWHLLLPTFDSTYETEQLSTQEVFVLVIRDADTEPEATLETRCYMSSRFDLWEVHATLCGFNGESESLDELLQLRPYGEAYEGEVLELNPFRNSPLSVLYFNRVFWLGAMQAYYYGGGEYLDYLATLGDLESEDPEQEEVLQDWLSRFIDIFSTGSSTEVGVVYQELDGFLTEYEMNLIEGFGDPLVLNVELTHATSYNQIDYIIYDVNVDSMEIVEGNDESGFLDSFSLKFSAENDPFDETYFGRDQSVTEWVQITVQNQPVLSADFVVEDDQLTHIFSYANGDFYNAYYFEITAATPL